MSNPTNPEKSEASDEDNLPSSSLESSSDDDTCEFQTVTRRLRSQQAKAAVPVEITGPDSTAAGGERSRVSPAGSKATHRRVGDGQEDPSCRGHPRQVMVATEHSDEPRREPDYIDIDDDDIGIVTPDEIRAMVDEPADATAKRSGKRTNTTPTSTLDARMQAQKAVEALGQGLPAHALSLIHI